MRRVQRETDRERERERASIREERRKKGELYTKCGQRIAHVTLFKLDNVDYENVYLTDRNKR